MDMAAPTSHPVVRTYLLISGLYTLSTSLIWGVNTLFLMGAGLSILEVFVANAVFTGSMALFEIPTGVLADTKGRRTSFLLSLVILVIGTFGYVGVAHIGGGLLLFCVMSVVLGLGYTFYSGAVEAWLVDALQSTNYEGELDGVFAVGSIVSGAAMLIGSIGGGFLGEVNLALPFLARMFFLITALVVAWFTMHDMGFAPRAISFRELPTEMTRIARASVLHGWRKRSIRLLMIAGFVQSTFIAWGFYAWQPYFLKLLERDLTWVAGVIAALVALATIGGNSLVKWVTQFCGKRTTLLLWASAIQAAAAVCVGLTDSFWLAVGCYLVSMGALGVWGPVRQAYIHQNIPSDQRASVISFDSLISSGGSMVGQLGLGKIGQSFSLAFGYVVGGSVMFLMLPIVGRIRGMNENADLIVGSAGRPGPCAAQGIPQVSAVDASSRV